MKGHLRTAGGGRGGGGGGGRGGGGKHLTKVKKAGPPSSAAKHLVRSCSTEYHGGHRLPSWEVSVKAERVLSGSCIQDVQATVLHNRDHRSTAVLTRSSSLQAFVYLTSQPQQGPFELQRTRVACSTHLKPRHSPHARERIWSPGWRLKLPATQGRIHLR